MKEKILYIVLAVSVGINVGFLSSLIYINSHRPGINCPPHEFENRPEQFEKFRIMLDSVNMTNEPYFFAVEDARGKLFETLKSENPDTHIVDSLLGRISMIQNDMEKNIVRNVIRLKNELPESDKRMLIDFLERRNQHLKSIKKTTNK